MIPVYARLRKRARQIVSDLPSPEFYRDFSYACELSQQYFDCDPILDQLRAFIDEQLDDDLGHGLKHITKVALDAGALMIIEGNLIGYSKIILKRNVLITHCAGLFHDLKRKHEDHSGLGAVYAKRVLKDFPFKPEEVEDVWKAIHNHEAFKQNIDITGERGKLVSDSLYDADKFRWGPDNFTDTIWNMVSYSNLPLSEFIDYYPKAMNWLKKIKKTFRTGTGKQYGPHFIDIGLSAGKELLEVIKTEYSEYL